MNHVYVCIKGQDHLTSYRIVKITPSIEDALDWIEMQKEYALSTWEDLGFYPVIPRVPGMTPSGARFVRGFEAGAELYGVLEYTLEEP